MFDENGKASREDLLSIVDGGGRSREVKLSDSADATVVRHHYRDGRREVEATLNPVTLGGDQ